MDATRFDLIVRFLGDRASRRGALGLAMVSSLSALPVPFASEAKKKHKNKKKKRRKKPCASDCSGKACGSDGCGGSCGPCDGGECQDGACHCPFSSQCSPGVCCASEEACLGGICQTCPPWSAPCDNLVCGITNGGKPCVCAGTLCISDALCFPCESDANCEAALGLPGEAFCRLVPCACNDTGNMACVINGCVDVEFCDRPEDCSTGTCTNHRCQ